MTGVLLIATVTPTDDFIALSGEQRYSLLGKIAAPIQEWTGDGGGVVFSERVVTADGNWFVVLGIIVQSKEVATAFLSAMQSEDVSSHFAVKVVFGPLLSIGDANEAQQVTQRIFKPFLE